METFVNKVAESGIITLDLTNYVPKEDTIAGFDLKPFLFREMILREKDYREALKQHDWTAYQDKHVHIYCSVDAIIPMWANMLAAVNLNGITRSVFYGTREAFESHLTLRNMEQNIDAAEYTDKRVVIKGCADVAAPAEAYVAISALLQPHVKSLMYGEPCSTVPVFKKKS
ncbi:MAG TPA: DUF2480 family protein [Chitinophagaceae bacterium]|nr:DUF2480 family protein [Chitinophagaceae bacterium]